LKKGENGKKVRLWPSTFRPSLATFLFSKNRQKSKGYIAFTFRPFLADFSIFHK
jgi:hypothetical protein